MPVHIHPTAPLATPRPAARRPRPSPGARPARARASRRCYSTTAGCGATPAKAADGELHDYPEHRDGRPERGDRAVEELCDLGLQRAIRVGTCGALQADLAARRPRHRRCRDRGRRCEPRARRRRSRGGRRRARRGAAGRRRARRSAAGRRRHGRAPPAPRTGLIATSDLFYDRDHARAPARGAPPARWSWRWRPRRCCVSGPARDPQSAACSR